MVTVAIRCERESEPDRHGHRWHKRSMQGRCFASPEPGEIQLATGTNW